MKKYMLLYVLGIGIHFNSIAQSYFPFPDSNAMWSYVTCYNTNPSPPPFVINCDTYYYLFDGDSLYNGFIYHKLYRYYDSTLTVPFFVGLIRQDTIQKKVYGVGLSPPEKMLYNFNANIGDTISEVAGTIVTMIDSTLTISGYRKRFFTNIDYIVDGIGSFYDLVYTITLEATFNLSCFSQNGSLVYMSPDFSSCNVIIDVPEKAKPKMQITISPNPITNCSRLITNDFINEDLAIKIFDYTGRIIAVKQNANAANFILCKEIFKPGYYFLQIHKRKQLFNVSFIVN